MLNNNPIEYLSITKVDPGELIIEVARNARYIQPSLQEQIARFIELQNTPMGVINTDPTNPNKAQKEEQ